MIKIPDYQTTNAIDLSQLAPTVVETEFRNYFLDVPGKEHYKLLGYFSMQYSNVSLLDVGTYKGCSALSLSLNPTNKVHSFDVRHNLRKLHTEPSNIEFIVDDILKEQYKELVIQSPFIILDTDHEGSFEHTFYKHLKSLNYKGILLLDDTKLNNAMKEFWNSITEEKYDVSEIGHHSGTGIVIFN